MKPKLGRKVYCIYGPGIFVDTVGYIGKDSFIVSRFNEATEEDSWEWYYEDYNELWFTSIIQAKKKLREIYTEKLGHNFKIIKVNDEWYELEF